MSNAAAAAESIKATRYIAKCRCGCLTSALCLGQDMNLPKDSKWRKAPAGVYSLPAGHVIDCRACGKPAFAKAVRGTYSAKHLCNAKCLASKGSACECECGGKNHGASYGA